MRENPIEKYLVRQVVLIGGMCPKYTSPGRVNVPDRLVLMPVERIWFVETKATGVGPNAGQLREHRRLRALGFKVHVLDSFDLVDQFIKMINWPAKPVI